MYAVSLHQFLQHSKYIMTKRSPGLIAHISAFARLHDFVHRIALGIQLLEGKLCDDAAQYVLNHALILEIVTFAINVSSKFGISQTHNCGAAGFNAAATTDPLLHRN